MSENLTYRKKLIEVALPLEAINKESAREKSIRHGHPSTLHLWWARRPLAACRAVLFASLVDDPSAWPELFPTEEAQDAERKRLFDLIEELVKWENINNENILLKAQTEIARSIARGNQEKLPKGKAEIQIYLAEKAPPVLDPFCGGGSIPLEAQRLGLRTYASDLNPVAVLITKALIEIPPKFANQPPINPQAREDKDLFNKEWKGAHGLAEDVRYYGKWVRDEAEKQIGEYYPKVYVTPEMAKNRSDLKPYIGKELSVIAWLWARTVASPNPACEGAITPLIRSFWLSTKKGKKVYVRPFIDPSKNNVEFRVFTGEPPADFNPATGTVQRTGATCLFTGSPISFDYIRSEGKAGRLNMRLMGIVCAGNRGRVYLSPLSEHEEIAFNAIPRDYPETDIPQQALGFRVQLYGMDKHYKLFTSRQLLSLLTFSDLIKNVIEKIAYDYKSVIQKSDSKVNIDSKDYSNAIATYIAFGVSRIANRSTTICIWNNIGEKVEQTFGRQAIPMSWDFAESNLLGSSTGSWASSMEWIPRVLEILTPKVHSKVSQSDAMQYIEKIASPIVSTDPPYYDNIGYADLSDFFYIWLRRALSKIYPDLFGTLLTPKSKELIATPFRHGSKEESELFFEEGLISAFNKIRMVGQTEFPMTIYYGFKQSETKINDNDSIGSLETASTGWEKMLEGVTKAGFSINGTWPMRTERDQGLKSGTNVLASSIVLVCRPKSDNASLATRREFLNALKKELPFSLNYLQQGNIAPVDLAQASIGPGMAIFTRFKRVMESDGSPMTIRTALTLINQTLDEVLVEQEGEFDSSTRWALAWYEQHGIDYGPFGVAETLSKAKNSAINILVESGIIEAKGGKVRLIKRNELSEDWDPGDEKQITIWEITQYLIYALERDGEEAAAKLLIKIGGLGETARDLAYRLYSICERKKWAQEALAYNSLVIAWPEITKLARKQQTTTKPQEELF